MEYIFDDNGNQLLPEPKSVYEVNDYIKSLIEDEMLLQDVFVSGEVSNFKKHTSGHFYFTLKDSSSEIKAVMFRSYSQKVKFKVENGQKVIVRARVGVYEQAGIYQLYVYTIQPEGMGALHLAFEQLKAKLLSEGLFDEAHKNQIPKYPQKIGIISSEYHLLRAGLFARELGLTSFGIPAKTTWLSLRINYTLREVAAVWFYFILGG